MPRTALTIQDFTTKDYPVIPLVADSHDVTFTAGDAVNFNSFVLSGREILLAKNTGVGARTITIQSVKDELQREGDLGPYTIGAGEMACFPIKSRGFRQTDGTIWVDVEHAEVQLAVVKLPQMA